MLRMVHVAAMITLSALAMSAQAAEVQKFGAPLGDAAKTPIASIVKDPAAFASQEVTVAGKVCGVCTMAGCWMEIEEEGARLRIKVTDGEIVFPADSVGHAATARGTVKLMDMTREQYVGWQRHQAEELGQKFDEASIGEPPYRVVQITGLGAEIGEMLD